MKTAQRAASEEKNFSHAFQITYADLTAAALTQTITLLANVAIGDYVDRAAFYLKTQFSGGSATSLTLQLGYTGTAAGLVAAAQLLSGATPVLAGDATGSDFATIRTGKAFVAASAIELLMTSVTANLSTLTAGEVHIFLNLVRLPRAGGFQ